MKICIYGAGAIGGHLAARLGARGDVDLSVVARGPHLEAIRAGGVTLKVGAETIVGRPARATDDPGDLPPQDFVLVTLKGPSLPAEAARIGRLLAPGGAAVFLMNGIPWWWNHGAADAAPLPLLDPDGALWREIRPERALHGVISSSNMVAAPGLVVNNGGNRWLIGEPDGSASSRVRAIVDVLARAGLVASVSSDIRADIWRKLFVNISSNPFAALTRLTSREGAEVPDLDDVCVRALEEALATAAALGHDLRGDVDARAIVRPPGGRTPGRSAMLQDVDAGRALEVEGIVGQVRAFARDKGVATPTLDVILPLLRGLDRALRQAREAR